MDNGKDHADYSNDHCNDRAKKDDYNYYVCDDNNEIVNDDKADYND